MNPENYILDTLSTENTRQTSAGSSKSFTVFWSLQENIDKYLAPVGYHNLIGQ